MKNSYKYFKNIECKYFPCHKVDADAEFNCLFCYCPMNQYDDCLGTPKYIKSNGRLVKDCSNCDYPHVPEHYEEIMEYLSKKLSN